MHFLKHNRIFKKSILGLFVLFMLLAPVSTLVKQNYVQAQTNSSTAIPSGGLENPENKARTEFTTTGVRGTAGEEQTPAQSAQEARDKVTKAASKTGKLAAPETKSNDGFISSIVGLPKAIGRWAANVILSTVSAITWAGGTLLQMVTDELVFKMGDWINPKSSFGNSISVTWGIIRDMCNLIFIFGFIYTGFRTIIDPEGADTKRFLSRIIIGALLINFSLFIVKFVIDFSNFMTIQIYDAITGSGTISLSAQIGNLLGVVTIFKAPPADTFAAVTDGGALWFYIMTAIILLVVAFVFFAAAILLIIRFVALVFIMIFSPILFAATVFPQTEHLASDLWGKLFSYSFFAPAYFLFTYIAITVLKALPLKTSSSSYVDAFLHTPDAVANATGAFGIVLYFTIAIAFFIIALVMAQKMGVAGGEMALKVGNGIRGRVQSAVGRNTVGRASHALLHAYEHLDARTKEGRDKFAKTKTGKVLKWGTRIGTLGLSTAIDDRAIRETLHAGEHTKFGGSYSYEDDEKYNKEHGARQAKINELHNLEHSIETGIAAASDQTGDQDRINMERSVSKASNEQVLELLKEYAKKREKGDKEAEKKYEALVANITSSQFDSLMKLKSDELNDTQKSKAATARAIAVEARLIANAPLTSAGTRPPIEDVIGKADGKDLDALSYEKVTRYAEFLTLKQIDEMSSLTPTSKARLKASREKALDDLFTLDPKKLFGRFKDVEIGKFSKKILTDPAASQFLNTNALTKILDNDSLTADERTKIKENILTHYSGGDKDRFEKFFDTPNGRRY